MTTAFTQEWLADPKNRKIISRARRDADEIIRMGKKLPHPFRFFQEMAWCDLIYSTKELIYQGWTIQTIQQYLANDAIFSFNGFDIFLAGAVNEAALAMPDGDVKSQLALYKLCFKSENSYI